MSYGYDVIGDVHGHVSKLENLLKKLGYFRRDNTWQHPFRRAVFVGDLIDRGPDQVRTCQLVKSMVEYGSGLAVMGNHEFNALAFHSMDDAGVPLRAHIDKNVRQHQAFLSATHNRPELRRDLVDWFWTLPLWLDLGPIRVVHACWHNEFMRELGPLLKAGNRLDSELLRAASAGSNGSYKADGKVRDEPFVFRAIETLLKGVELELPNNGSFIDKDGHTRRAVRVEWWRNDRPSFREAALLPESSRCQLPDIPIPPEVLPGYSDKVPVFIGHYWRAGEPALLSGRVACVDYSAGKSGKLMAYRWSGEETLQSRNFIASDE